MNKFSLVVLACIAGYITYDIKNIKLMANAYFNHGTLSGLVNCVSYSKSEVVSEATTRNACANKMQTTLYDSELATGRAGTRTRQDSTFLEGSLNNNTANYVTTWVRLAFNVHGTTGAKRSSRSDVLIWIEPQSSAEFSIEIDYFSKEEILELDWCEVNTPEEDLKSCKSWGVEEIKGLKI